MSFEYLPISAKSIYATVHHKLLHGTRGSAKTTTLFGDYSLYLNCGFGSAYKGYLFRSEFRELEEIKTRAKEFFPKYYGAKVKGNAPVTVTFPGGETLTITIMKTVQQENLTIGQEIPWIGYDEITMIADQEVMTNLVAANRTTLPIPARFTATCNPWGVGRDWVKRLFKIGEIEDSKIFENEYGRQAVHIHSTMFDNPHLINSKDGLAYIKSLGRLPKEKKEAWLYGSWDFVVGGFLESCWSPHNQVVKPFQIPKSWNCFRSFDWGYSSPFSVGYYVVSDGADYKDQNGDRVHSIAGDVYKIYEIYGGKFKDKTSNKKIGLEMSNPEIAKAIKKADKFLKSKLDITINTGPADSQIFAEENNNNIAKQFKSEGIEFVSADKSSRVNSSSIVVDMLSEAIPHDFKIRTESYFKIWDNCKDTIRTLPSLQRCPVKLEDISQNPKQEDHAWDETRYALTFAKEPSNIEMISSFRT